MPCPHKFQDYLNLEKLDFQPETLIVGTFNPSWPEGNYAEWFYGRIRNNYFWDVLTRMINPEMNLRNKEVKASQWKLYCKENKIALTDLIYSIEDADYKVSDHQKGLKSYSDASICKGFSEITFTDIVGIIQRFPSIKNVYLTTQAKIELINARWSEVEGYCFENGVRVKRLLTSSASARFQMGTYKSENPNDKTPLRNFIYKNWKDNWH
jgi:hypothetical protein